MCVICVAAKKRHMKREEVLQAIKANSAGFFGFTVHDGARRTVRTLDDKQFMKFFDDVVEDDVWVMHARIPSRGDTTLDNVHGWEEDGIIFCHNMTLSELDGMMKRADWKGTDSEFFFRHIFMPFYRGLGEGAYRDGKFHPDLDNIVTHFCGYSNKLCFIMPDNRIIRYGTWVNEPDRREGGEIAFWASNASYKVYKPAWKSSYPVSAYYGRWGAYDHGRNEPDDYPDAYDGAAIGAEARDRGSGAADRDAAGDLLLDTMGELSAVQLAMCELVATNAVAYKAMPGDWSPDNEDDDVQTFMAEMMPDAFSDVSYDAILSGLELLVDPPFGKTYTVGDFARDYCGALAGRLLRKRGKVGFGPAPLFPKKDNVIDALKRFDREWRIFKQIANLRIDWNAKTSATYAIMSDTPVQGESGRWKVSKVAAEDLLVDSTMTAETVFKATDILLKYVQARLAEPQKGSERSCA